MKNPRFNLFYKGEVVQFIKNVLSIFDGFDLEVLKLNAQVTALSTLFTLLEKLYILDQGNAITEEIKSLDQRRDDALIGINANVDSYLKHYTEEKRKAAAKLRALLDKYGRDLHKKSYPVETAGIRNLKSEIAGSAELTAAVETLGLTDWLAELDTVNELFDEKYLERNKAYAEAPKEKFAEVREEAEDAYLELARHLTAHAVVTPDPAYQELVDQINQLVATYNLNVQARIGGSGDKTTE